MSFLEELKYQLIIAGILLGIGWGMGYYMGSGTMPEQVTKTVTEYVPRMKPKDLGEEYSLPQTQLYYKSIFVDKLRVDTVYVPKELDRYRITDLNPININAGEVTFTYFNPEQKRYEEQIFSVPERAFSWGVYLSNKYHIHNELHYIGLEADAMWKRVGVTGGGFYSITGEYYYYAGLKIKLN